VSCQSWGKEYPIASFSTVQFCTSRLHLLGDIPSINAAFREALPQGRIGGVASPRQSPSNPEHGPLPSAGAKRPVLFNYGLSGVRCSTWLTA
jgi:hypothetical protein